MNVEKHSKGRGIALASRRGGTQEAGEKKKKRALLEQGGRRQAATGERRAHQKIGKVSKN